MNDLKIVPINGTQQVKELASLAEIIWREHFTSIIGAAQVTYMLDKFQSVPALTDMLQNQRYQYFFFCLDGKNIGYIGIQPRQDSLFLSKLYLLKEYRGNGYARCGIHFLENLCRRNGYHKIELTCNRNNLNSVAVYRKMDFDVVRNEDADIGNGFVMNDYIMEKNVDCLC